MSENYNRFYTFLDVNRRTIFVGFNIYSLRILTHFWLSLHSTENNRNKSVFAGFLTQDNCVVHACKHFPMFHRNDSGKVNTVSDKWLFSWWNPWTSNSQVTFPWNAFKDDFHFVFCLLQILSWSFSASYVQVWTGKVGTDHITQCNTD